MPFVTRKISNYGTENPVVARVSFQWTNLMHWFDLSIARKEAVGEALLLQVQPRLLSAKEIAVKHHAATTAVRILECDELARAFFIRSPPSSRHFRSCVRAASGQRCPGA
jgi:hypothetical protein